MTDKIRAPRTVAAATALLEQFAEVEGDIGAIEANRSKCIADVNNRCDTAANPLLQKRAELLAVLEPWWEKNAADLTKGKRKSIELGGCMIGTVAGRDSLAVAGNERAIAKSMLRRPWAKALVRNVPSLDKVAILKAIDGAYKRHLAKLGLTRKEGDETFYVVRAEQEGTLAGAVQ